MKFRVLIWRGIYKLVKYLSNRVGDSFLLPKKRQKVRRNLEQMSFQNVDVDDCDVLSSTTNADDIPRNGDLRFNRQGAKVLNKFKHSPEYPKCATLN